MAVMLFSSVTAAIDCSESMTRTVSSSGAVTGDFQIKYQVSGASGKWGVSVVDAVSGGCKFPGDTSSYKEVFYSEDGSTYFNVLITVPEGTSSCSFNGDYMFGECAEHDFAPLSVTISCTNGATRDCTADNTCAGTQTCTSNEWGDCVTGLVQCQDGQCQESCPDPTCDEVCGDWGAWSDNTDKCGDRSRTCPDDTDCTTTMSKDCPSADSGLCEWYEKEKDGQCEPNIMLIVLLFFAAMFFMRMMSG